MKLHHITSGLLGVNTYFLISNKGNAVVIDGGEDYNLIKRTAEELSVKIVALFLTHGHFDHVGNAKKLQDDGAKVYISGLDAEKIKGTNGDLGISFGRPTPPLTPDYIFKDGEEIEIDDIKIKVLLTPGHTDGSATFIVEDMLFTGDTLFFESYGRVDFPTGSVLDMQKSLLRLFALKGEYKVYPGHGEFTSLTHERTYNPLA